MPEHPDTLIWVAGVKPALAFRLTSFFQCFADSWRLIA